ncbi:membrane protein insertase YidC [Nocardiopsis sp. N85]|uniref:YidC/Oxa1 family membrane protein insertase n=1 Tax=Nocardiopsis sp. N85 TaxID=3029400 RepID=UPI00237F7A1C|nr:membrane protein insertase YidC [Nocardiopsis sp. N85]MDE3723140.1 membrane protein insertase YidC [Nocardiopsis sp. N85]
MYSVWPISVVMSLLTAVLTVLTTVFAPLVGAPAAALAVVGLTIAVRLLLVPFGVAQVRAEKVRARIAPRLAEIAARYPKDPEKRVAAQQKVYVEAGTSPLAGCLPSLAQLPVVIALYGVFIGQGPDTDLLTHTLAGVALGATPAAAGVSGAVVFGLLLVLLALVAWGTRRFLPLPATTPEAARMAEGPLSYLPFLTVVFAAFVPLAAGLYLLTSGAWALGERLLLRRLVPEPAPKALPRT